MNICLAISHKVRDFTPNNKKETWLDNNVTFVIYKNLLSCLAERFGQKNNFGQCIPKQLYQKCNIYQSKSHFRPKLITENDEKTWLLFSSTTIKGNVHNLVPILEERISLVVKSLVPGKYEEEIVAITRLSTNDLKY